jgi:hypothetical protein
MVKLTRRTFYIILSTLICLSCNLIIWKIITNAEKAEYESMSLFFYALNISIIASIITLSAFFLNRDKFLKQKTMFFYIFSGTLNLNIGAIFILYFCSFNSSVDKTITLPFGIILLLIGLLIYYNIFATKLKIK